MLAKCKLSVYFHCATNFLLLVAVGIKSLQISSFHWLCSQRERVSRIEGSSSQKQVPPGEVKVYNRSRFSRVGAQQKLLGVIL